MHDQIKAIVIPPVTREFADHLRKVYPVKPIKNDMNYLEIGRLAGQQEVVEFILKQVTGRTVSGNPDLLDKPLTKSNIFSRLFSK